MSFSQLILRDISLDTCLEELRGYSDELKTLAKETTRDKDRRAGVIDEVRNDAFPSTRVLAFVEQYVKAEEDEQSYERRQCWGRIGFSVLRILRNAAIGDGQLSVLSILLARQDLLQRLATWTFQLEAENHKVCQSMIECLCNSITCNESAQQILWSALRAKHTSAPHIDFRWTSFDTTKQSYFTSSMRVVAQCLPNRRFGHRTMISGRSIEREDDPEEEDGKLDEERLRIIYLFSLGLFGDIYTNIQPEQNSSHGTITTEQVTFLKLFDAHLCHHANEYPLSRAMGDAQVLLEQYQFLAGKALSIMSMEDGEPWEGARSELIAIHQGLVLLLQAILAFVLPTQGTVGALPAEEMAVHEEIASPAEGEGLLLVGRILIKELRASKTLAVEQIVSLLKTITSFSPAISPFQPLTSAAAAPPPNHIATQTGEAKSLASSKSDSAGREVQGKGLRYLKRDLLRLLTSLVFLPPRTAAVDASERATVTEVQDRVRESDGLYTVLSMTVLDVENPCELLIEGSLTFVSH
ncbi:hypothetical protein K437DRAFT_266245 [Tilletiaria anomala UBC 951]|uniref:Ataxin-10 domain-containing protein n=1 Tax=Tilletiaria anomala (strain ATCC 24038 / CBS 436.72 / UBC 951) TaxID=1037660 RepID=A0A066WFN7_TILAU|nr:uncharacterized protein K437DRAFT_266245 [Tilletiaria anomala UBC 951]KDN52787.1 hypothetical protein K437DRAFT_266245 [Tilletiaria anomala UBC 951]